MKYDIAALKRKMLVKYPFFGSVVASIDYKEIIDTFLTTNFSDEEKHHRRVEMIDKYGN